MSVIAELSIPASEFVLGRALRESPEIEIELEQMVPTGETTIPYFWVTDGDFVAFEAALEDDPEVIECDVVDEIDDQRLYRISWDPTTGTFVHLLGSHDLVLQRASGDDERWSFQLRFPDSHSLSEFHTACRDASIPVDVEHLYNPIDPTVVESREMTDAQRSLVVRAYEEGYFDVPRRITLTELAEKVGVSDQAVNERLRRGLSALIAATVAFDDAD